MNITQEWLSLPNETLAETVKRGYQEPAVVQERLLMDILREAADTEIGRKFDFGAITSVEEYCMWMPLTEWHDVEPYSDRMAEGVVSNLALTERAHAHFVKQYAIYETFVEQGLLRPIEVRLMKSGWQESLYAEKLRLGVSTTQIKLPVVIAKPIDPSWER